jgi:Zn-dependent peptidase ImmA (M78 family)
MPLQPSEQKKLEQQAWALIQQNEITAPPVSVENIAKNLGLNVTAYDLGNGVSGALFIENNIGSIGYNPAHPKVRQRFTIAHEIAHYCLHKSLKGDQLFVDKDFIVKYRNASSYSSAELKQEQEANCFGAALLMPKDFVLSELNKEKYSEHSEYKLIEELAKLFDVSVPAMTYRLSDLHVFF